jgi:hypothetical protein
MSTGPFAAPPAAAPGVPAPPAITLPTVPGLPVQLPNELSMPRDLVCEGTGF